VFNFIKPTKELLLSFRCWVASKVHIMVFSRLNFSRKLPSNFATEPKIFNFPMIVDQFGNLDGLGITINLLRQPVLFLIRTWYNRCFSELLMEVITAGYSVLQSLWSLCRLAFGRCWLFGRRATACFVKRPGLDLAAIVWWLVLWHWSCGVHLVIWLGIGITPSRWLRLEESPGYGLMRKPTARFPSWRLKDLIW